MELYTGDNAKYPLPMDALYEKLHSSNLTAVELGPVTAMVRTTTSRTM